MPDSARPSTPVVILTGGAIVAGVLVVAGMFLEAGLRGDVSGHVEADTGSVRTLEAENERLNTALGRAQAEVARLQSEAGRQRREPIHGDAATQPTENPLADRVRDAISVRTDIATALREGNGQHLLHLLAELAALGEAHYPEVAAHWVRLTGMDPAALDRLGLSRIDLASALVRSENMMRFVLEQGDLDPTFRQFTARTLEQASTKVRRGILDDLDFSTEKDKSVLHALVRATSGFKDEAYVDRFLHLVQRTDLYNDSRSSIAFRIAEIEGDKSRAAIDLLRVTSGGKGLFKRMLPVLESIYSPPATGLLVTNGMRPADQRIGHNDVILEYAGHAIRNRADLTRVDSKTKPGQVVSVKIVRDGAELILRITVTNTAPGHLHFSSRPIVKR